MEFAMNISQLALMYSRCEITTVALQDRTSGQNNLFYNIYSLVEFCHEEQEKSENIKEAGRQFVRYKVNKNYNVFIQRDFIDDVQVGLNFYRGKGHVHQLPKDFLQDYESLIEEPPRENCILFDINAVDISPLMRVLPHFDKTIWLSMKLSQSDKLLSLLTEEERWETGRFIEQHLGIPLNLYNEFWGGMFLCAKNAQLRYMDYQLGKDRMSLIVSLLPFEDAELYDGWIELFDERRYGAGFYIKEKIKQSRFMISFPYEPEKLHVRVYDKHGQLQDDRSSVFLKEIRFNMGIQSARRIFSDGKQKTEIAMKQYDNFVVGKRSQTISDNVRDAEHKRYLASLEKERIFIYFAGKEEEKERAAQVVRELIASAKERCVICDPYFSKKDFLNYGIHVTSVNLVLKIVTSAAFLKTKVDGETELRQGKLLHEILKDMSKHHIPVMCYVLKGTKSPLHDRFIVIDDEVYLLGSSLSEFGSRATTLYRVPDPNLLIRQVERWMQDKDRCPLLEEWINLREESENEGNDLSWNNREAGVTS